MARLTYRHFRKLLECIGEIYTHHDLNGFAQHVLQLGRKAVPADFAAYEEVNARQRRHRCCGDPPEVDVSIPAELDWLYHHLPFVAYLKQTGDMPPLRLSDFVSRPRYRESPLYRELYRDFGVEYQLGFVLPSPTPDFSFGMAFNRRHRDFSEEDRLVFKLLRPHLLQAYHNAEQVTQLQHNATLTAKALELASVTVLELDARGRVRRCPLRARRWLADYFGATTNGRLPEELLRWIKRHRLPGGRTGLLPELREPLVVRREGGELTVRLLAHGESGQTLALTERRTGLTVGLLRQLGLTVREAEVLLWLAQGKTNPEIGIILGSKPATVHKHTEHIFEKLGVETRTAAAARAWEALNRYGH